jgi:DNA-binding CsgD family transcriptional regulator
MSNNKTLNLTPRELEIINLLVVEQLSIKEIVDRLHITRNTYGVHRVSIYNKCAVMNNVSLCLFVLKYNLVNLNNITVKHKLVSL